MKQYKQQDEDVLSYALFPQVATDFFKYREAQQTGVDATKADTKNGAKCISYELKDRQIDAERVWFKAPTIPEEVARYEEPVNLEELVSDVTLKKLNDIFQMMMRRQEDRIDPIRSKFGRIEKIGL